MSMDLKPLYLHQLLALLPPGAAWPRDPGTVRHGQLSAIARSLATVHARADQLLEEADPRSAAELLIDWERVAGLPDPCTGPAETTAERRDRVVARLTARGGQSRVYFIGVAAALGYAVTIEEFPTACCEDPSDVGLNPWPWPRTWMVHAPAETVRELPADGASDEPLRTWGNQALECALHRHQPAHTNLLIAYGD